ncbi:hypothetical protein GCM10027427_02890 [Pseudoclavibacter terrae]
MREFGSAQDAWDDERTEGGEDAEAHESPLIVEPRVEFGERPAAGFEQLSDTDCEHAARRGRGAATGTAFEELGACLLLESPEMVVDRRVAPSQRARRGGDGALSENGVEGRQSSEIGKIRRRPV